MLVTDALDRLTLFEMPGRLIEMVQMIVIGASGDTRYAQKQS